MNTVTVIFNSTEIDRPMIDLSDFPLHSNVGFPDMLLEKIDIPLVASYYDLPSDFEGLYAQGCEKDYRLMRRLANGDVEIIHEFTDMRLVKD
jgi:hypothetical protein